MIAFVAASGLAASLLVGFAHRRLRAMRGQRARSEHARAAAERWEMFCPVTGLANRRRAVDWLASAAVGGRLPAAIVVAIDCDRFGPMELATLAGPVAERLARLAGE